MLLPALFALAASAQLTVCSAETAQPATIGQIMDDPQGYNGSCVTVAGLSDGIRLLPSVEAYYLAGATVYGDPAEDPGQRGRLGLDNYRQLRRIPRRGLHHLVAVGRVQICEEARAMASANAQPGQISWISGFCHMANGPYLWLSDVQLLRGRPRPVRLAGEGNRARLGNLAAAPADWPHLAFVQAQSSRWLSALHSGDRAEFARLHLAGEPEAEEAEALAFGRHRGFADIRRAQAPPRQIFLTVGDRDDKYDYRATICFCRSADCSELWPISAFDADNREDRPYVCTRFVPFMVPGRGVVPIFITQREPLGLPEPRSSRR